MFGGSKTAASAAKTPAAATTSKWGAKAAVPAAAAAAAPEASASAAADAAPTASAAAATSAAAAAPAPTAAATSTPAEGASVSAASSASVSAAPSDPSTAAAASTAAVDALAGGGAAAAAAAAAPSSDSAAAAAASPEGASAAAGGEAAGASAAGSTEAPAPAAVAAPEEPAVKGPAPMSDPFNAMAHLSAELKAVMQELWSMKLECDELVAWVRAKEVSSMADTASMGFFGTFSPGDATGASPAAIQVSRRYRPSQLPTLVATYTPTATLKQVLPPWMEDTATGLPLPPLRDGVDALYKCASFEDLVRLTGGGDMCLWSQVLISASLQPTLAASCLAHHRGNFAALRGDLAALQAAVQAGEAAEAAIPGKVAEVLAGLAALAGMGVRFTPPWTMLPGENYGLSEGGLSVCKTGGGQYDANVCGSAQLVAGVHEWRVHFGGASSLMVGVVDAATFERTGAVNQHYKRGWWVQVYQGKDGGAATLTLWAAPGQGDGLEGELETSRMGVTADIPPFSAGESTLLVKLDCTRRCLTFGTNGVYHSEPTFVNLPKDVQLLPAFLPLNVGLCFSVEHPY